ncbi:MAG: transposase, partial [Ktedonobacteraceae bacterium]|nr:transposase [Ktedonobacteraceae bacterium]
MSDQMHDRPVVPVLSALLEHPEFQAGLALAQECFFDSYEEAPLTEEEMLEEVEMNLSRLQAEVDPSFCVGIDLGVTDLAAIAANRVGFVPRLVNGRPLKAWNQWYNKRIKELKKKLPKEDR